MRLYGELVDWYSLVSRPKEYAEEAAHVLALLAAGAEGPVETLLELGAGAGHLASHLTATLSCTLSDLSPDMLALSRQLNSDCEHVAGDMRSLRLDRLFDAVLIHDAVGYMTTEADPAAAIGTAAAHLRGGGVAIFIPDDIRDDYAPHEEEGGFGADGRSLRYVERSHVATPGSDAVAVDFELTLRDGEAVRVEHDRHFFGLFDRATWHRLMQAAGFEILALNVFDPFAGEHAVFVGRKT